MDTAVLNPTQMHLLKLFAFNNSEDYALPSTTARIMRVKFSWYLPVISSKNLTRSQTVFGNLVY